MVQIEESVNKGVKNNENYGVVEEEEEKNWRTIRNSEMYQTNQGLRYYFHPKVIL
ncbi:6_t:CDS:2 [Gigaspora margarita]|uniref:6_t:CDS:1 n=1 Tax=Gigaspora margarita TaxID=4874 RepID=A0ABN7UJ15_GIGMA|nr:6_t:CDS:2 [Gigaspora margarita]